MSVALAEPVDLHDGTAVPARPALRLVEPTAPSRTGARRPGPGVGPAARPRRLRFVAPPPARARACQPPAPERARARQTTQPTTWHLTERGLAVVLAVAAALVVASVVVVGLTALRVTGESYHPGTSAAAPVVVAP